MCCFTWNTTLILLSVRISVFWNFRLLKEDDPCPVYSVFPSNPSKLLTLLEDVTDWTFYFLQYLVPYPRRRSPTLGRLWMGVGDSFTSEIKVLTYVDLSRLLDLFSLFPKRSRRSILRSDRCGTKTGTLWISSLWSVLVSLKTRCLDTLAFKYNIIRWLTHP